LDPYSAEAYVARGGSYHLLGEHDRGLADRTLAISIDPNFAVAYIARGNAYFLLNRWDEALADLSKGLSLDPNNADAQRLAVQAKAKVDEAIQRAMAKEKAPDSGVVVLPATEPPKTETAKVEEPPKAEVKPEPKPEPKPEVKPEPPVKTEPPPTPAPA